MYIRCTEFLVRFTGSGFGHSRRYQLDLYQIGWIRKRGDPDCGAGRSEVFSEVAIASGYNDRQVRWIQIVNRHLDHIITRHTGCDNDVKKIAHRKIRLLLDALPYPAIQIASRLARCVKPLCFCGNEFAVAEAVLERGRNRFRIQCLYFVRE